MFKKQPANMRLLVVVDKLLTGFDSPPCTYLYINKSMQDHGLFQAICRTNRLDGEDKPFGYIVDYKDLFKKVQGAMAVYTSELDHSDGGASPEVLLQDRLKKGRERLDGALEAVALLCEPVQPPQGELEHIHYFCGITELRDDLAEHAPQRVELYKSTAALVRAYANVADDLSQAPWRTMFAARSSRSISMTRRSTTRRRRCCMILRLRPGAAAEKKQDILEDWYRRHVKEAAPALIAKWERLMGVKVQRLYVQRMKTKWGSCNHGAGSIRLNTDLAKKPKECLEYIVVHEMVHLLEPTHNARFMAFMEQFMPKWQLYRERLNRLPVRHESWLY